jgi:hypothetical protein
LFDRAADINWRQEDAERQCLDMAQELIVQQARIFELCQAIVSPPTVQGHLSEWMRIAAIRHTEMVGQLSTLQAVVSSVVRFVLGRLSTEAFWVDVVDEILTDFWE